MAQRPRLGTFSPARLAAAFRAAGAGVLHVLATEGNARVHLLATVLVTGMSLWLELPFRDLALLALAVGLVWVAEIVNTAVERCVDLATDRPHELARQAKDAAAGAALVAAITAVLVGVLVLGPPLWQRVLAGSGVTP